MSARVFKTLAALIFGTGQEVAFQLASALLWISFWGRDLYAEWLLLTLIPMLMTRGNAGIFHCAASQLIAAVASGDEPAARTHVATLARAQRWSLGLVAIVLSLSVFAVSRGLGSELLSDAELALTATLFVVQFALFQWHQGMLNLLKATGAAPRAIAWQNGFRAAFIICMLGASPWFGPVACLAIAVAAQLGVFALTQQRVRTERARLAPDFQAPAPGAVRTLLTQGLQFSAMPFGQTGLHSAAVWALGAIASPLAGAAFHNLRTITRLLVLAARAAEQAVRLELSAQLARGDAALAARLVRQTLQLTAVVGVVVFAGLVLTGPWVFELITRGELPYDRTTFVLLCTAALAFALAQAYLAVLFATNAHGGLTGRYLVVIVLCVLAVLPVAGIGSAAVAVVMLVSELALVILARSAVQDRPQATGTEQPHGI